MPGRSLDIAAPPAPPPTRLGRHRLLSPLAGIHLSPLCLGAMSIGDKWNDFGFGSMDKESSFKLLDAFYEAGGNFIDTANGYQDETSEMFIGEWAESRGIRDQLVIATKYTGNFKRGQSDIKQHTHYAGNHSKSLRLSLEASLEKLRTSYIDILYVHFWDWFTSVEEVMNSLHNYVVQGKVLYLGISDCPAWIVSKANQYARDHGKTPFAVYQGMWSALQRDIEREIIPMCRSEGLAIAAYGTLERGKLRTDAEEEQREQSGEHGRQDSDTWKRTEDEQKMSHALEKVAKEAGTTSITAVAIAYVMQKMPFVFPIVGGRKVAHLRENMEALKIALKPEQIQYIESVVPFDIGWPAAHFGNGEGYSFSYKMVAGHFDAVAPQQAIRPA